MANKSVKSVNLLPEFLRTDKNSKFLSSTLDQLIQPAQLERLDGYIGSKLTPNFVSTSDFYIAESLPLRQNYQLEPALVVRNEDNKVKDVIAIDDLVNEITVSGGIPNNFSRMFGSTVQSYNPQIDWDKFINFQSYYWLVNGPNTVTITGAQRNSTSTFTVIDNEDLTSFVFTPDGLSEDPLITLYRGSTYSFNVSSTHKFYIKTAPSPEDGDLYNIGVVNNGVSSGTVTISIDKDTPNTLFYAADDQEFAIGQFTIQTLYEDSVINVEEEVIGKANYTSGNGVQLSNGMKIKFAGTVIPEEYGEREFFVEGVGSAIKLIEVSLLQTSEGIANFYNDNFDATNFDEFPFDNFKNMPIDPEYITINRASRDLNPWSRYNRWVHVDVISASAKANGIEPVFPIDKRAKRPIIEFNADLKLYNFGSVATSNVDLIDTKTTDAFSFVEGTAGYYVDGVLLQQGHRVIFNADTDVDVRGKIFEVNYLIFGNSLRLELKETVDHTPVNEAAVSVNYGDKYGGTSWWYNGSEWTFAQQHTNLNEPPLFDLFDSNGNSYSDKSVHETNFTGCKIFGYEVGTLGADDPVLGFPLTYKNSIGVGSYLFKNYFMTDSFNEIVGTESVSVPTSSAYFRLSKELGDQFANVWDAQTSYAIPILQQQLLEVSTNKIEIIVLDDFDLNNDRVDVFATTTLAAALAEEQDEAAELSYSEEEEIVLGTNKIPASQYSIVKENGKYFINFVDRLPAGANVLLKIYSNKIPNSNGYYEMPIGLTNNPMNGGVSSLTLSEISDHVHSMTHNFEEFTGDFPGSNNSRDLSDLGKFGTQIVSNTNPLAFSNFFIGKKEHSVVDAITKVGDQYNQFKLAFLQAITRLSEQQDVIGIVDLALKEINKDKDLLAPYYLTDMVAYGSDKVTRSWTVTDARNVYYPISSSFDPTVLSTRSVLVYLNGEQLIIDRDYIFDVADARIEILTALNVGDSIVVDDYVSTKGCFVPPTPTKLGLYPKYYPEIVEDNSYVGGPVKVIQGHDGSLTVAFNDYRDYVILELEKRIYNNIKASYRPELVDVKSVFPGAFRSTEYSVAEVTQILQQDFIKWAGFYGIDYSTNSYFDEYDPFTWNYTKSQNNQLNVPLVGHWRSVFKYFYDTDRPDTCPWEMLGFSNKPSWWEDEYGPAPYTSGNELLWTDLESGTIRQGDRAGVDSFYARPGLSLMIPVDDSGNLLDPTVNLSAGTTAYNRRQGWKFGDHSPAETAWRRSSYWPFAVQRLLALAKPADYCSLMYDPVNVQKNIAGQWAYTDEKFLSLNRINVHGYNDALTSGFSVFVSEVGRQRNSSYLTELVQDLQNTTLNLFYKVGGFVSKEKLQIIIDSYDPTSTSPGALLPQENYELILNVSNPVKSANISGIIIQKIDGKFVVKGYDRFKPYFTTYSAVRNSNTPTITVGGISAPYVNWSAGTSASNTGLSAADTTTAVSSATGKFYQQGQIVSYGNKFYMVKVSHQAGSTFNASYFQVLPSLPMVGGATVQVADRFNKVETLVSYGAEFNTIQEVYDLIVGYGEWLKDQGFIFDEFNTDLNEIIDWKFSGKEFLYWTTQNWANNSIITLSPFSDQIKYQFTDSVVDNVFNSFYDYSILQANGIPFPAKSLNVNRQDGLCTIKAVNSTDGIFFAVLNSVQKEHAMVFDNTTVFNDTIYDIETGYRQRRMKLVGFRTANWDGDYFSPGFVYDTAEISNWIEYTDYRYGSIVRYAGNYYSANQNVAGAATFDFNKWNKLGKKPVAGLVPNFDYKINQFEDFYSLDIDNFDIGQQELAQHLTGYTPRVYLNNIFTNPIAQYKFYQGFIKEKGTKNAITKLAKASIHNLQGEVDFTEEWAFRVGYYGGFTTYQEIELPLQEGQFIENPQVVSLVDTKPTSPNDLIYYGLTSDLVIKPDDYNSISAFTVNPGTYLENDFKLSTAGFVRLDDVTATAYNENSLLDIANNSEIRDGDTIWLGFKQDGSWDVLRYSKVKSRVTGVYVSAPASDITFVTDAAHGLSIGDIISVSQFNEQVNGIYIVKSIPKLNQITVASSLATIENADLVSPGLLFKFVSAVFETFDGAPSDQELYTYPIGSKLWINDNGNNKWVVYEKTKNFTASVFTASIAPPLQEKGYSISKRDGSDILVVGSPGLQTTINNGLVTVYRQLSDNSLSQIFKYTLNQGENAYTDDTGSTRFGHSVVYDDVDYKATGYGLLFVGAPDTSYVKTNTVGSVNFAENTGTTSTYVNQGVVKISSIDPILNEENVVAVLSSQNAGSYENFGYSLAVQRNDSVRFNRAVTLGYSLTALKMYLGQLPVDLAYDLDGDGFVTLNDTLGYLKIYLDKPLTFVPNPTSNYYDLISVNKKLLVGAPGTVNTGTGRVYSYLIDSTSTAFEVSSNGTLSPGVSLGTGSLYGHSISCTDDSYLVAVGAPGYETATGVVTLFAGTESTFLQTLESPFGDGGNFGYSVRVSSTGSYVFVSAPTAVNTNQSFGKVAVYEKVSSTGLFTLTQVITNPVAGFGMRLGEAIDVNVNDDVLAISAIGTNRSIPTTFEVYSAHLDSDSSIYVNDPNSELLDNPTTYDALSTEFYDSIQETGTVYVYNRKSNRFVYAEELQPDLPIAENNFGNNITIAEDLIYVGAPAYSGTATSAFYQFASAGAYSWNTSSEQEDLVAIDNLQRVALIDAYKEEIVDYLDVIDPLKGKIAGLADQELKYKSAFDPAIYSIGVAGTVNDTDTNWLDEHLGELWWDLSTVKYVWYEQSDDTYRKNNWGKLFPGATIDVYEWVKSEYLPSEWSALADTTQGLTEGISGQPKFADNSVISVKQVYNSVTNSFSNVYYYWVKNKVTVPNVKNRRISSYQVASLIADPTSYGLKSIFVLSSNSFALSNVGNLLVDNRLHLNVAQDSINNIIPRHTEWLLLQEGSDKSFPNMLLEKKLIDSLLGRDSLGNLVPDPALSDRTRYGVGIRPRQTLFKDRKEALRNLIEFSNEILINNQITGNYSFKNLDSQENIPDEVSREYDQIVEDSEGLLAIDTRLFATAELACTIKNGRIRSVSILNSGYGYRVAPTVTVAGSTDALLVPTIDLMGRITSVEIVNAGSGFVAAPALEVRPYTVIMLSDQQFNGKWAKYIFDTSTSKWERRHTQKYNTTLYWKYVDWVSPSYNPFLDFAETISSPYQLNELTLLEVGQYVKIKNGGDGRFVIVEKIGSSGGTFGDGFDLVYSENGTIQILDTIWDFASGNLGFDQRSGYDQTLYDQAPDLELSYILSALKNDIFINELKINWNLFFFKAVKYALSEQKLLDWAFKTSFINVTNNAGTLDQRPVYKLQDSTYYEDYIKEVKPYHTTIRSFTTRYDITDPSGTHVTDFDLPTVYNQETGKFENVLETDALASQYPWKSWFDNYKFGVGSVSIGDGGSGYVFPPEVRIITSLGDAGSGATAQAYIRSGQVVSIEITNPGSGYTIPPAVVLIGGGDTELTPARAYAQLENNKIRINSIDIKFDRITRGDTIGSLDVVDSFVSDGSSTDYLLSWVADPNKNSITVTIDGAWKLSADYTIEYFEEEYNGYTKNFSKLVFLNSIPPAGQLIKIQYRKSSRLLNATERILNFYDSTSSLALGSELPQLMSGIEYPRTRIEGLPLNYTARWDIESIPFESVPWSDDVNSYFTVDVLSTSTAGTNTVVLTTVEDISVGKNANVISYITNVFNTNTVYVTGVITSTNSVVFNATLSQDLEPGDTIEFWSYDANSSALDSNIIGGTWEDGSKVDALGVYPEDITINGDGFITPDYSYAPEEVVPGSVFDSLGISVYTKHPEGAPVVFSNSVNIFAGSTTTRALSIIPPNKDSIFVVFGGKIFEYREDANFESDTEFTINWVTNEIVVPPQTDNGILGYTIISIGGGVPDTEAGVIDSVVKTVEGVDTAALQSIADFGSVKTAYVTVNGNAISKVTTTTEYGYMLSSTNDDNDRALVSVYNLSTGTNTIQAWFFGTYFKEFNEVKTQIFTAPPTPTPEDTFTLSQPPGSIEPAVANAIVEVDNGTTIRRLAPPYIGYFKVNSPSSNSFDINTGTMYSASSINPIYVEEIRVYRNGEPLRNIFDWYVVGGTSVIIKSELLETNDVIAIVKKVTNEYGYDIKGAELTLSSPIVDSDLKVTTFTNHDDMMVRTERFMKNPSRRYKMSRPALNINYVWVTVDGIPLIPRVDYEILDDGFTVQVSDAYEHQIPLNNFDDYNVVITSVSSDSLASTVLGYRIFNDIFNRTHFKRLSKLNTTVLSQDLNLTDTEIHVADAGVLTPPNIERRMPGVVYIDGERIEFYEIDGNTLKKLRRSTLGTAPSFNSQIGTKVIDQGHYQTVPYSERILRQTLVTNSAVDTYTINQSNFSTTLNGNDIYSYGITLSTGTNINAVDQVAVYYGGRLLRKSGTFYHDTTISYDSPIFNIVGTTSSVSTIIPSPSVGVGDAYIVEDTNQVWIYSEGNEADSVNGFVYRGLNYLEPEFSINTSTQALTLNIGEISDNVKLTIVKKEIVDVWNTVVSSNETLSLMNSDTVPANFLRARPAELPDVYYYGGDKSLIDETGFIITDADNNPLSEGY